MAAAKKLPKRPAPKKGGGLPLFWIVIGAVVVIGVVVVAISAGGDDDSSSADVPAGTEQSRPVTIGGDALAPFAGDPTDDSAVGAIAPTLEGANFAGDPVTIGPDGTAKMVAFVAHWCPHCQAEVPRIKEWLDAHALAANVELYFVSTRVDEPSGNYPPSSWLADVGVGDIPTIADDEGSSALTAWGAGGFPYVVYVDGDNKVLLRTSGEYGDDPEAYTPIFEALAAGETPTDPRL